MDPSGLVVTSTRAGGVGIWALTHFAGRVRAKLCPRRMTRRMSRGKVGLVFGVCPCCICRWFPVAFEVDPCAIPRF